MPAGAAFPTAAESTAAASRLYSAGRRLVCESGSGASPCSMAATSSHEPGQLQSGPPPRDRRGGGGHGRRAARQGHRGSTWRLGGFAPFRCARGGRSVAISVLLVLHALLLIAFPLGAAGQQSTEIRACLDLGTPADGAYFLPTLVAAYALAAEHVQARNCSFVPECKALLSAGTGGDGGTSTAGPNVRLRTWHPNRSPVASAAAAAQCHAWDGDVYLLERNSLVDTVAPVNTANGLVTVAPFILATGTGRLLELGGTTLVRYVNCILW